MAILVYGLCTVTAFACAALLLRGFAQNRTRLLMWSGLCFAGLTLGNLLVVVDVIVFPHVDLYLVRQVVSLISMLTLVTGLVLETK